MVLVGLAMVCGVKIEKEAKIGDSNKMEEQTEGFYIRRGKAASTPVSLSFDRHTKAGSLLRPKTGEAREGEAWESN